MKSIQLQNLRDRCRGFSPILALIIIGLLILIVFLVPRYMKATAKDTDLCYDLKPWKEWRLREASEKPIPEISSEQPALTEELKFDTNLKDKESGDPRGELAVYIGPDGSVGGSWGGAYYKGRERNFDIMGGSFGGRVYPGKIYRDEAGEEDPTKLYLMARGEFMMQESDTKKGMLYTNAGDIYVQGWLDSAFVLSGEVTITSNEKYFETFTWRTFRAP
ncbi:MAG: hypothetical protein ACYS32_03875 [Planctomycetota bacterium]|jgi:hypothetical protein